ncbi:MAG: hypothetical protein ACPG31_07850 [Planctomycetota bacterium]
MKVVVLGGSTPHTVGLVEDLLEQGHAGDPRIDLMLVGRNEELLEDVRAFCNRRIQAIQAAERLQVHASTDATAASHGADLFVFQVRPGGLAGRASDETFPLDFGIPGDEGLGPGGLAAAKRNFLVFASLLPAVQASPTAPILMLTNPLGLSGRWFQENHAGQVLGVCELPQVTLEHAIGHAVDANTDAAYAGLNHQGFWHRIRQGTRDVLPETLATAPKWMHHPKAAGALPLSYWRLYFDRAAVVREQRQRQATRAATLTDLCTLLHQECREGDGSSPLPSGQQRAKPWYSMVVTPMLLARARGLSMTLFANQAAGPQHAFAAPACQVERRILWGQTTEALAEEAVPRGLLPLLQQVAEAEEAAWHACAHGNAQALKDCLRAMPLCEHLSNAERADLAETIRRTGESQCV